MPEALAQLKAQAEAEKDAGVAKTCRDAIQAIEKKAGGAKAGK